MRHHIVKVAVDPRGDSRVDPQTASDYVWSPNISCLTNRALETLLRIHIKCLM